jgi:hypothetical protein
MIWKELLNQTACEIEAQVANDVSGKLGASHSHKTIEGLIDSVSNKKVALIIKQISTAIQKGSISNLQQFQTLLEKYLNKG